jgi:tetratricopeptide (TPR) repeat protein
LNSLIDDLKKEIARGQTVVIIGAGVSIGATNRHKCASWTGLLHDGVDRCVELNRLPSAMTESLRSHIDSGDLDFLLSAAEVVSKKLGAPDDGEYRRWLRETIGALKAENKEVIQALSDLGAILATTNYDNLIEEVTGLPPITWKDSARVERVLRGDEKGVLHLHGYWQNPQSVILGIRSYEQVLGDDHAQTLQRAVAALKSILFVGCGEGLSDPNFGSLLEWTGKVFAGSEYRCFRLALDNERELIQQQHSNQQRLFVLSYGQKHDDLAGFLRGLKPESKTAEPLRPAAPFFRLPARPRCFGREDDLKAMVAELLTDQPKPIPILGAAGIGKSTLALAAMHDKQVAVRYGERRYFIRCDGIKTRNNLAGEIARLIGLDPSPNIEPAVLYELANAPAILALDNAETPWEADTLPVEELLGQLASVSKLALIASIRGSERPGGVRWREAFHPVALRLPAARETFLDIAGRNFATDPRLDELLEAIDCVPLAIMLIAHASEGEPNLENVWQRWQAERTTMLRRAGGKERLTNIEVSYEFSINSPRRTHGALRLLRLLALLPSGLAAKDLSLVMRRDGPAAASVLRKLGMIFDESERLRLLAPLREYVRAKYEPEPFDQQRLVSHFMGMAETLGYKVGEEGGAEAVKQLTPEAFNIEEILSFELKKRSPQKAINATLAWAGIVKHTGIGSTVVLEHAATAALNNNLLMLTAHCVFRQGEITFVRSDYAVAAARYEESLQIYRGIGDTLGEANCIRGFGNVADSRSDYETAEAKYEEALQIYRGIGDTLGEANCIQNLGRVADSRSDYETAEARYEEALRIHRRVGNALGEANCIQSLGSVADSRSDYETAEAKYEEALQIFRKVGNALGEANCIGGLGGVAQSRSDYETAASRYEEALQIFRRIGNARGEANCLHGLGNVADSRSDYETAEAKYEEALQIYRRIGDTLGEANCFHGQGKISLSQSDFEIATERFNQALNIYRKIGALRNEAECLFDMGRLALAQKDRATAHSYFEQAATLFHKIDNPLWLSKTYLRLVRLTDDEAERKMHLETAHSLQERLATADVMRLLEEETGGEE